MFLTTTILLATLAGADPAPAPAAVKTQSPGLWLDDRVTESPGLPMGPFVRLRDGRILTIGPDGGCAWISGDEGKTWQEQPIFTDSTKFNIRIERALICTRSGAVIVAFMNDKERASWKWDPAISDSPGAKLPTYVVRSPDGGKSWETPQKLHDDWTGAIRDIIQTRNGEIVFTSMMMLHNPGRHTVLTYTSQDDGRTWKRSNIIDKGGVGHHGGVTEATIEELRDGRLWMLIRTNWKTFWEAYSTDGGLTWDYVGATNIDASSSPGLLKRLASGRLILIWNRYFPEGKNEFPLSGGDNQWSEVPVSNHRLELSMKLSDDDGRTWTEPVVIARTTSGWLAYPYLFEARPGELWITTMQGGLRVKLNEQAFVGVKAP